MARTDVNEVSVSSRLYAAVEAVTKRSVLALPPKQSCMSMVSLLLRYGTKLLSDDSAEMTSPSVDSDLLMELASRCWSGDAPDLANRSLPAKSSRLTCSKCTDELLEHDWWCLIFQNIGIGNECDTLPWVTVPWRRLTHSMLMPTMRWDRELRSFICVDPVWRECNPWRNTSNNISALAIGATWDPCTHTIPCLSFLISNFTCSIKLIPNQLHDILEDWFLHGLRFIWTW